MNTSSVLNFKMSRKAYIHTFGCQMNLHDSERMAGILSTEGYSLTDSPQNADIIIFNTCSIRQKAEQKFRSELGKARSLKKEKPSLKLAVAGCIAQQQGMAIFKKNHHVDYVFGPGNIHFLKDVIRDSRSAVFIEDNPAIGDIDLPVLRKEGISAWVSIMYGCDNFCSYCVVPYTRGREKSRPTGNIYSEVCELAREGYREITLLGQNVNSYRSDLNFAGLLRKLDGIKGIERIRFVTSHPRDLSDGLIACMKELPRVCEHIHLPLQSGSDRILGLMNRGYTYDEYLGKIEKLRNKVRGIAITTDIIAGFPSETDSDHASTIRALGSIEFDGIFAFKYSSRKGTKAAEMDDQVPDAIRSERLSEILTLQDEITSRKNRALEGTVQEVIVEGPSKTASDKLTGRTRTNKIVNFKGDSVPPGRTINVEITRAMRHSLNGRIAGD